MKIPKLIISRKKLRATTARRSLTSGDMEFEEMSEPNMKLSRALLIVLVLHVVAVAGIIAFNTIKSRQGAFPPPVISSSPAKASATAPPAKAETVTAASSPPAKATNKDDANIPKAMPVNSENGNFYTVVKGDSPVKIAKKLKVSESELLSVNHIDDPRKLQIGQKLIIPKSNKSKKS
ncbi:MAG: LysM peptidoglycan-binding domain-containing protein [Verrucomicrobiota bacterium]|nr:LysM peptidoglycan-binding domain-containing protein [Verrucomicrobiota bacterium]MDQ6939361.1 LysM peptidoglycan-binding domain-containing protein [Verrucomicrobiota bacterium]